MSFNSNNSSITIESMNEARSLENGWESHVISKNSGWGSHTHLNINSGWGTNSASNEVSDCT